MADASSLRHLRVPRIARDHVPPNSTIVRMERMSPAFAKFHLDNGRALHWFTRPEPFANPHDHPWSFETEILSGGYVEEVFTLGDNGAWRSETVERAPGSTHHIPATHIHRIVHLPMGECWTLVRADHHERRTMFWRFGEIVQRRAWNARKWSVVKPPVRGAVQLRLDDAW